jgi:Ca2+-binding RTX toxin-like protein
MQITDPQLSAMADNGGPTNTMIPALNSPAVNAVTPCTSSSDQRGQQRPIGPGCDIGAVEIGADIRSAQSISNPAPSPGSDVVITATFSNAGMDDAPSTTGTITVPRASAVLSTTVTQGTCTIAGTTVNCGFGTLKRSQPATVIVVIRAPGGGDVKSTASVSSPLTDGAPGNNTSSVTASVKGGTPGPAPQPQPTACSNVIAGTPKNDRLKGTANGDTIRGRAGADRVKGLAGDDCLFGDGGADRIVGGAGSDRISGGAGNDVIRAKDGTRDVIRCGAGRDTVVADRSDKVRKDCERVRRR